MFPSLRGALLLLSASCAAAPSAPPPVQVAPVVVQESPLAADAAGVTTVVVDPTEPSPAQTFAHLSDRVANLHLDAGGAGGFGDIVALRGLANTPYFSDPAVTVYFDDIPLGSTFTYPTGLFGFARATVARGPQGAASGRGGEAGQITFASAEPGAQPTGELRFGAGNFSARSAAIEADTARGQKADATFAAAWSSRAGYITNRTLGIRVDDQNEASAAARFRWRPAPNADVTLQLLGNRRRDGAQPLVPLGGPLFSVARGREGTTDSDFGGAALKVAFDTSVGRLSATTSHTDWTLQPYDNRLTLPPTLDSRIGQTQRAWNEELRLASSSSGDVTWHAGAWLSDATTHAVVARALVLPTTSIPIEGSRFALEAKTLAAFGGVTLAPAPGWKLTLGARAEEANKRFARSQQVPAPAQFAARATFDSLQPQAALDYTLNDRTELEATVAVGARPGGWSGYTDKPALAGFGAERAVTVAAGARTVSADRRLSLAAHAFAYAIRDYQIERSFTATDYLVFNAPRARSVGTEIEATWHPTRELAATATVGATDVRLRDFTDPFTHASYAGRRAPYVPDYDAHVGLAWHDTRGFRAGLDLAATGRTTFEESENNAFASPAHVIANTRVGYEAARWRVVFYGENVGNAGYTTLIIPGVRHAVSGAPRTWGVEATVKW